MRIKVKFNKEFNTIDVHSHYLLFLPYTAYNRNTYVSINLSNTIYKLPVFTLNMSS